MCRCIIPHNDFKPHGKAATVNSFRPKPCGNKHAAKAIFILTRKPASVIGLNQAL